MSESVKTSMRTMLYDRLPTALSAAGISAGVTANPQPGRALPYVDISTHDEDDSFRTQSTNGVVINSTIRVWAESIGTAESIADTIIQDQTDRSSLPPLSGSHQIILVDVLSSPTIPQPSETGKDLWQIPIRLRYQVHTGQA